MDGCSVAQPACGIKVAEPLADVYLSDVRALSQDCCNDVFVFFRFQGASGVNNSATGLDGLECASKNALLPCLLVTNGCNGDAMANLGITSERSGAAAWHVAEYEIETFLHIVRQLLRID